MEKRISILRENQQLLGNKINMLQETNRKKDEEAEKIRELITECRQNLDRIKCEAMSSKPDCPETRQSRSNSQSGEGKRTQPPTDPCRNRPSQTLNGPSDSSAKFRGSLKPCDPCANYRSSKKSEQPCEAAKSPDEDPCARFRAMAMSSCEESPSRASKGPCESRTSAVRAQISAIASAQDKSRQCIERLEREIKMKGNESQCDPCADGYQERVSCRVDLNKMKVNVRGPPEDLKKLDAVQLINLLDKFQCQELVLNTGENDCQLGVQDVPVFYLTHPGNLVLIVGIAMVAFLVNANLCGPRRECQTKILNMLYLGSFAFHYGIVLWMSFIRGLTLSFGLPRDVFNTVDNLILPKYFSLCVFLSALTLYSFLATHCAAPCTSWPLPVVVQVIIESATFLIELIAMCYIVPAIVKLREVTDEYTNDDDDYPPPDSYCRNMEKLAKLSWTVTIINTLTVIFMGSNMYYISSKLNIG